MSVPTSGFAYALTAPTLQPPRTATPNGLITAVPSAVRAASAAMSAISAKREANHDRAAIHSHRQKASPRTATPNGLITAVPSAVRAASAAMSAISAKREANHDRAAIHSHRQKASLHRDARNPPQ